MSIKERLPKIEAIASSKTTRQIYKRDKYHIAFYCESVRDNSPFQVILDWTKTNGILTLKTELFSFDPKLQPHPANNAKTICYQALGVAKKLVKEAGKILSFCKSEQAARNLLQIGGELVKIVNLNGGVVWATVR